ncbi:MAG: hypothetical protein ACRDH2_20125, partial [Anaerolineales bacterium]
FSFANNTGINRRLVGLTLTWPDSGGRKIISVNFGTEQVWSGNGNNSPFSLSSGDLTGSRLINAATSKTLKLNFNYALSGTGGYTLTTQWDDTNGGSVCTAPSITISR